jgi:MFS family permease
MHQQRFIKNRQYYKFCLYGFLKNLRFFEPFLVLFFLEKGLSFVEIGILYAVREIATNILEIPTGFLSDALGRRRTMMASFLFYILSFILFYVCQTFWFFVFAMTLFAVGEAFRTGTHKAMIFDYLKNNGWADQKVYYYGHTRSWSQFGSAISSLIAAGIVFYSSSFKYVFLFATLPYLLDLILIASYPKNLDGPINKLEKKGLFLRFQKLLKTFWITFNNREVLIIANNISLHTGYFKAIKDYLQPILQTYALSLPFLLFFADDKRSALVIGIIYFFIFLLTSFASRHAGKIAAYFNNLRTPLNVTLATGLLAGAISGMAYFLGCTGISIVIFILIYLIENLRKPIGTGHFASKVEEHILVIAFSAQSQLSTLWGALIAISMGIFVDWLGIGQGLFILSLLLLIISILFKLKKDN